jgi:hypothetical protein
MAAFTFGPGHPFPAGTTVSAYQDKGQNASDQPMGLPAASGVVGGDGALAISGLAEGTTYWAVAQVSGRWIWARISVPGPAVDPASPFASDVELAAVNAALGARVGSVESSSPSKVTTNAQGDGPNLLNGHAGNTISAVVSCATIAGGGQTSFLNKIDSLATGSADYSTISGGYDNTNNQLAGTIAGGAHHLLDDAAGGTHGTILGGSTQKILAGQYCTIAGGRLNTINSGDNSTIAGGYTHSIDAANGTIGGGFTNTISSLGQQGTIAGGQSNTVSAAVATVGGGRDNIASGDYSTVPGGRTNTAAGHYSLAIGRESKTGTGANGQGQLAHAAGMFAAAGDAQVSHWVLRKTTTDATVGDMFTDGSAARPQVADDTTWMVKALVVARRTDADNESAAYELTACFDKNTAGSLTIVGAVTKTVVAEDTAAWDATIVAGSATALAVRVTGEAAKTIRWVAYVTTVEVSG